MYRLIKTKDPEITDYNEALDLIGFFLRGQDKEVSEIDFIKSYSNYQEIRSFFENRLPGLQKVQKERKPSSILEQFLKLSFSSTDTLSKEDAFEFLNKFKTIIDCPDPVTLGTAFKDDEGNWNLNRD